ncbi:hypothetical protein HDU91_004150, partial [Kappamyces sp. JEL0680]
MNHSASKTVAFCPTEYSLFRATRSCQTEATEVCETKELGYLLNLLAIEADDSGSRLRGAVETQIEHLAKSLAAHLDNLTVQVRDEYRASLKRIEGASLSRLGNGITIMWKKYEKLYETRKEDCKVAHNADVALLAQEIKDTKRQRLALEWKTAKLKAAMDRWTKLAKKTGVDLDALYREDKTTIAHIDQLAQLQRSHQAKHETLAALREKLETEKKMQQEEKRQRQDALRKKLRMANVKLKSTVALGRFRALKKPHSEASPANRSVSMRFLSEKDFA